jgi:murein L,D-transpeptidase YcbB/YkuD
MRDRTFSTVLAVALVLSASTALAERVASPSGQVIGTPVAAAAAETPAIANTESPFGAAIRQALSQPMSSEAAAEKQDRDALAAFFAARGDRPLWTGERGFNAGARAVIAELGRADDWGLMPADFPIPPALDAELDGGSPTAGDQARAEIGLSLSVLKYARYARGGRIAEPSTMLSSYLDRKPQLIDPRVVLDEISAAGSPDVYLRGLHPTHPQFEKLRQEYLKLRNGERSAAAVRLPATGPLLRLGSADPQVAVLRKRLNVAVPTDTPSDVDAASHFDAVLDAKVREFQRDRRLGADGIVGGRTRAALNRELPEPGDPRKLVAAMEQWRWMPAELGSTYVWVNIPEFMVRVIKDGALVHTERVVVGKPETQTPIFSEAMQTVVMHPNWNVPESIKVKELLPRLAAGEGLRGDLRMRRNGKNVDPYNVNWSKADIRNYEVYQPSGGGNALGELKFLFPNKHSVYLHDTPSKGLFNETTRTFSHGCMRLRNPQRLAELLLGEDKGWDKTKVKQLLAKGPENNAISLDHKIPVHVTYFTAVVDDDGTARYFRDIYGHEKRIQLALDGKWSQIVKNPDHLAPVKPGRYVEKRRRAPPLVEATAESADGGWLAPAAPPAKVETPKPAAPTPAPKWSQAKPRGNSVGDMISRSLGFSSY